MSTVTFSRLLEPGDPAPWFTAAILGGRPDFPFAKLGGWPVLIFLFGSTSVEPVVAGLRQVAAAGRLFGEGRATFLGVSVDERDHAPLGASPAHLHVLDDRDRAVSRLFGAAAHDGGAYRPHWVLLDAALRVTGRFDLGEGEAALAALQLEVARAPADVAPVLSVANVLEPALCRRLIDLYETHGGVDSGFMRQEGGRTVAVIDHGYKRRADHDIADPEVRDAIMHRLHRRLVPMIRRAFQFDATRIERYIVACYDAADGGHFNAHRDNTTSGTAHRRFAVTINLNDEYDGGDLRFPEWGPRLYRAPVGGAVVFSCSMLHEATPVTRGRRYATLPFLYDEAAAKVREANHHTLLPAAPAAA